MFQSEAPLHEIGRMQLSIRHGRNCHRLQTGTRIRERRCAGELAFGEARVEYLIRGDRRIDRAVGHSRRDRRSAYGAQQTALEGLGVRRIHADQIDNAAGQQIAEQAESAPQDRLGRDLPGNRRSAVARIASGVDSKMFPRPVWMAALSGWFTS